MTPAPKLVPSLREFVEGIFFDGVVNQIFCFGDFAGNTINRAKSVGQAIFDRLVAAPDQAGEQARRVELEPVAATILDSLDELLMHLAKHCFQVRLVFRLRWGERIHEGLVFAGRDGARFDTEFLHGLVNTKTVEDHADGTDETRPIDKNLVRSGGDVIAPEAHISSTTT